MSAHYSYCSKCGAAMVVCKTGKWHYSSKTGEEVFYYSFTCPNKRRKQDGHLDSIEAGRSTDWPESQDFFEQAARDEETRRLERTARLKGINPPEAGRGEEETDEVGKELVRGLTKEQLLTLAAIELERRRNE